MSANRTYQPRWLLLALLILGSLFFSPLGAVRPVEAGRKPHTRCSPAGDVVPSPDSGSWSYLKGVAAVSASDAWAVGAASGSVTLIERWDGTNWTVVPSPNSEVGNSELSGVTPISASDAWAVGTGGGTSGPDSQALIEHWDGTDWALVSGPSVGATAKLRGVSAVAANDVWAVGSYSDPATTNWWDQVLVLHWDGISWSRIPSPSISTTSELHGVAAVAANDVWAVGFAPEGNWRTVILHWDGSQWSRVPSPNVGPYGNYLYGVFAVAANDVWAVGAYDNQARTLILHWDGANWSVVSSPNTAANYNLLLEVAAVGADNVWAVGYSTVVIWEGEYEEYYDDALVLHWNGATWSIVPGPLPPASTDSQLRGVAALPTGDVWAVGYYAESGSGTPRTLIERFRCQ